MIKFSKNTAVIFLSILAQSAFCIIAGLLVLFLYTSNKIAPNIHIGAVDVGKLSIEEAAVKIQKHYEDALRDGSVEVKIKGKEPFKIKFSDIGARLDTDATTVNAYGRSKAAAFLSTLKGYFDSSKRVLYPQIAVDENRLRSKLVELATLIDSESVDAYIDIVNGKVIKRAEKSGFKLNMDNAAEKLKSDMGKSFDTPVLFDPSNNYEIETIKPKYTIGEYFKYINDVLSQYTTDIISYDNEDSIRLAATAINGVLLKPEEPELGPVAGRAGRFAFNRYLAQQKAVKKINDEGYNQVASTLYAAVLEAGMDHSNITKTHHEAVADYIAPGLDIIVLGDSIDFCFDNTLNNPVLIYAEVKDGKVIVSLIGTKSKDAVVSSIKTEVTQRIKPSVVNVEVQGLKPGEKRLVTEGSEGLKVKVYKVFKSKGATYIKEPIDEHEYKAKKAVIEVGPNMKFDSIKAK